MTLTLLSLDTGIQVCALRGLQLNSYPPVAWQKLFQYFRRFLRPLEWQASIKKTWTGLNEKPELTSHWEEYTEQAVSEETSLQTLLLNE